MRNLPFTKDALEAIVEQFPTPFHIYDEAGIRANVKRLQESFSWNEGFREYFAVKALPNPMIMKLLYESGCGMDCSSLTELLLSRAIGVTGHDVMFSSNDTPASEFQLASEMGVLINLDDITHIDFLAANGGIPKTVCLRFNPGGEFLLGNTIMGNPGEAKYGMTREQLSEGV
jgi:diaminopimelate decarboxylase